MTQADLVDIRAAVERALAGSKVTAERITVFGREPCRIALELRGAKDDGIALRVCSAVSRLLAKVAPGFYEIAVGWEPS